MSGLLAAQTFDLPANIAFGLLAAMMLLAAIRVVTTDNVVHAALWLVVVLAGIGANYLLLQAEFAAIAQIMVYIGAIVVLFLFGIMLTHNRLGRADDADNPKMRAAGAVAAVVVIAVLGFSVIRSFGDDKIGFTSVTKVDHPAHQMSDMASGAVAVEDRTGGVSDSIFGPYLLPFELVSLLLLAALIGAIVLARKE